jgi:hypothetical protein
MDVTASYAEGVETKPRTAKVRKHPNTDLYLLEDAIYEMLKTKSDLRCFSCPKGLQVGDIVYPVKSGTGKRHKRHLQCAIAKNVLVPSTSLEGQSIQLMVTLGRMLSPWILRYHNDGKTWEKLECDRPAEPQAEKSVERMRSFPF